MSVVTNRRRNWCVTGRRDRCRGRLDTLGYRLLGSGFLPPVQEEINKGASIMK
jgi:hypothetical protein